MLRGACTFCGLLRCVLWLWLNEVLIQYNSIYSSADAGESRIGERDWLLCEWFNMIDSLML